MANYKYNYNEEPAPPAPKDIEPHKYYTVYPNNVLVMGILSFIFSLGWVGLFLALYALQKERIYRREHEGETCTKVKIGKIFAISSIVILGVAVTASLAYYIIIPIVFAPEEVSQVFAHFYSFI